MEEEHATTSPVTSPVTAAAAPDAAVAPTTAATAATSAVSEAALSASSEGHAAETTTTGAGESSVRRRSSKHHRKGGKKHQEKAQASDNDQSQPRQPQEQLSGVDGVTQAASGTTLATSPSQSSDKALSPQPPEPQAAVEVKKASGRAGDEERLVVPERRDSPQPTATTTSGLLEYWPLAATIVVLVVVILVQLLIAAPIRLQRAPRAHRGDKVCESEPCRHYAKLIAGTTNLSASACDNFYAHVCGRARNCKYRVQQETEGKPATLYNIRQQRHNRLHERDNRWSSSSEEFPQLGTSATSSSSNSAGSSPRRSRFKSILALPLGQARELRRRGKWLERLEWYEQLGLLVSGSRSHTSALHTAMEEEHAATSPVTSPVTSSVTPAAASDAAVAPTTAATAATSAPGEACTLGVL
ncbi:uncharacterized protein LOC125941074 [Dermacentor silvarum]|uniref:uncharacterized protein LOC125941074 n=1 Tax=Dermacentor silvarum TaxID=543639 RepID=UPI002100CFE2|nr:uncharacterized protein LOC125941074 [Dermacentor silvarum]